MPTLDQIIARLSDEGIATDSPSVEDLNRFDQMHMGGVEATDTLIELAAIGPQDSVLDAGCGIGGTSRRIAAKTGAAVTGLDLTPEAIATARRLNALAGMSGRIAVHHGSITAMPFDAAGFDVVVVQHAAMQIEAKDPMAAEIARVLRPGGRVAFHDWFLGDGPPVLFPLPWAQDTATSFLEPLDAMLARLPAHGLHAAPFADQTEQGIEWMRRSERSLNRTLEEGGTLSESQVRIREITRNMLANLGERRLLLGFLLATSC